jgi:hypothetical protein
MGCFKSTETEVEAVEYRIDRAALVAFIGQQVDLVEATELSSLLGDVVELRLRHDDVRADDVRALWLGAGLASHVGLTIFEEPERFITVSPTPASPAALAA